jgi:hypothetical protein
MLFLLLHAASAEVAEPCSTDDLEEHITALSSSQRRSAYGCLAELDEAGPVLLERVTQSPAPSSALTRALAVHWMQRLDQPFPHEVARAIPASDRRLLSDAVRARRGRASPAPEHAEVFEQFAWYAPNPRYTDGRLTTLDRENIAVLSSPPEPPKPPEEEPAAAAIASAAATPATERGCQSGCATAPGWSLSLLPLCAVLAVIRRRRA